MHRIIRESLIVSGLCLAIFVEAADQAGTTALHVAACQCDLEAMKAAARLARISMVWTRTGTPLFTSRPECAGR